MTRQAHHRQIHLAAASALLTALVGCDPGAANVAFRTHGGAEVPHFHYLVGEVNQPTEQQIGDWLGFVQSFWSQHFDPEGVAAALDVQELKFIDQERIVLDGREVRGYSTGRNAVVGMRTLDDGTVDWSYVESLVKHELSHGVLGELGVVWDEAVHHKMFADLGYGY